MDKLLGLKAHWPYLLIGLLLVTIVGSGTVYAFTPYTVSPSLETTSTNPKEQRRFDDPAIWIHPTDPALSLIIGANKAYALLVYDLDGNEIQDVDNGNDESYNNVDVRYRFPLDGELVDIVVATQRDSESLEIYKVDVATRQLIDIGHASNDGTIDYEPYGIGLYHDPATDKFYAFVTDGGGNSDVRQYELIDDSGTVKIELKRTLSNVASLAEGVVADDINGIVYIAEEANGIYKYDASPDPDGDGTLNTTGVEDLDDIVRTTVLEEGEENTEKDLEGLTLYYAIPDNCNGKSGYLLASSQGNNTYHILERDGNNMYLGYFSIDDGTIDGTSATDGIDVTNLALGSNFPNGFFIVHDDADDLSVSGNSDPENFKMVDWNDIAVTIPTNPGDPLSDDLCVDTSWHPRIVPPDASAGISNSGEMQIGWVDDNLTSCYAVYRDTDPYFVADATTLYDDTLTASTPSPYIDSDPNALGVKDLNYFYTLRAKNCDDSLPQDSERIGGFNFEIQPGAGGA